jgi:hypothetical protein
MQTSRRTFLVHPEQISGVALILILCLLMAVSCDRKPNPSADGPPAPEAPVSDLQLPDPVVPGDIRGEASLPDRLSLGFAMDLDGRLLGGNWSVEGNVTEVTPGRLTLVSNQQREGHFVYRLPAGLRLFMRPGQTISVQRDAHLFQSSMGYNLLVESSGELALAAGSLVGSAPREVRIRPGLFLRQIGQRAGILRDTKYETTYVIPLVLSVGGMDRRLQEGELTDFGFGLRDYSILVLRSSETVATENYKGIFDGGGYLLRYVLVSSDSS